jgi:LPXTG-motif cell wall-anchored protein
MINKSKLMLIGTVTALLVSGAGYLMVRRRTNHSQIYPGRYH